MDKIKNESIRNGLSIYSVQGRKEGRKGRNKQKIRKYGRRKWLDFRTRWAKFSKLSLSSRRNSSESEGQEKKEHKGSYNSSSDVRVVNENCGYTDVGLKLETQEKHKHF